jgi:hypothetical protein
LAPRGVVGPEIITGALEMAEREREVIVTDGGDRGSGGAILAVVLVVALLVVLFLVFGRDMLSGGDTKIDADVKIDAPATGTN